MMHLKFFTLILMSLNTVFSLLLFLHFNNDTILSVFTVFNLCIAFILIYFFAPDVYRVKLAFVYLLGFSLFICGRFISNILGMDETFCFDFGYFYCLSYMEKIKTVFLINISLILFLLGFLFVSSASYFKNYNKKSLLGLDSKLVSNFINKKILVFFVFLTFILGGYVIYSTVKTIQKAISGGYLTLYESQSGVYNSPILLIVTLLFNALLALLYAHRNNVNKYILYLALSIYIVNSFLSIFSGSRANFFLAIILFVWLYLGEGKIYLKKAIVFLLFILAIFSINKLSSISGARIAYTGNDGYLQQISSNFYDQGITMMVFSLGSMHNDYPFLAYIKTVIPGSQIIVSFFKEIYLYEFSFSQYLLYKISPTTFNQGYGIGWSLLGDFYAFSFGFLSLFMLFNFFWGRLIFVISAKARLSNFYLGLYFCFLISVFILSRFSISSLLVLVGFYIILSYSLKLKWK